LEFTARGEISSDRTDNSDDTNRFLRAEFPADCEIRRSVEPSEKNPARNFLDKHMCCRREM